jgi:hypothetical protein
VSTAMFVKATGEPAAERRDKVKEGQAEHTDQVCQDLYDVAFSRCHRECQATSLINKTIPSHCKPNTYKTTPTAYNLQSLL